MDGGGNRGFRGWGRTQQQQLTHQPRRERGVHGGDINADTHRMCSTFRKFFSGKCASVRFCVVSRDKSWGKRKSDAEMGGKGGTNDVWGSGWACVGGIDTLLRYAPNFPRPSWLPRSKSSRVWARFPSELIMVGAKAAQVWRGRQQV